MPRSVTQDRAASKVNAATSKTTAKGSGGGAFRPVTFTPGEREIYNRKGKK